tara:strand:- start:242009 stop:242299 length:291 start_codon:yes stop_codon:yes gene_type:complete
MDMVNCNDTIRISNIGVDDRNVMNGPTTVKTVTWRSAMIGTAISVVEKLRHLQERARDRKALQKLDDHLLKDIGMTRAELDRQLSQSHWTNFPPRG